MPEEGEDPEVQELLEALEEQEVQEEQDANDDFFAELVKGYQPPKSNSEEDWNDIDYDNYDDYEEDEEDYSDSEVGVDGTVEILSAQEPANRSKYLQMLDEKFDELVLIFTNFSWKKNILMMTGTT